MSVTSKTQIANLALVRIGAKRITDLADQESKGARVCNEVFDQIMEEVIRSGNWNCLKARATLSVNTDAPEFGWTYSYALPTDCAKMVKLNGSAYDSEPGDPFEVEGVNLFTDADYAQIKYIKLDFAVAKWDALLIGACVTRLAAEIAAAMRSDGLEISQGLMAEYENIRLPKARIKSGNERKKLRYNPASESRFLSARRFSTNG